ncbi:LPS export ABC transporter periplasmic protein LptC [Sphingopyxis sp. Root1497]|jgi:lipopolysaccharide export system protein LptC|uniref:LPS export ABC transporter periplasmic protein LptC n=1 Tax=Sphingopyxis sp. Root1497 TaxID=1736474 RepID=UPI0006FE2521|nr:LPS export ABC transporter periplasmic protein LptC [Sphingopyxis sp. Root1497]KQZ65908.1 LPS export ABC transporter periplasmic protein LptC [Sphingopyxis sp. Root1497]OHC98781.1 MAG: LPS export ABC transporter periplasmic protein LptC [Sphingopyxis sp. RIFCSPHIGHO2_01_FULL_65_24]
MSARADHDRTMRQLWATSGSSHDRVVRILRFGLPLVIGVVAAVMIFSPFTQRTEVSFLLAKDKVEVAQERMKVTRAEYRGQDTKGQPFALVAGSAVQKSSAEPIVRMEQLSGAINLADGPATIAAAAGQYNMDTEQVAVPGAVRVRSADGYRIDASNVAIDLKSRSLTGRGGVNGTLNIGNFSANALSADLDTRVVRLSGNARLRINQGVLK